ncbi:MAG: CoA-acylating methylmalonate-semialdehyde dehydrogenase [Candidatus Eisenbacteria bacterium]|uniref:methylmalonate-semialdehyde dehydrogenase (CoA acylating) n=1 Tax=Eiseniibacteriota bacterium TaxID=2212470 RepID=A0A7Y2H3P9_UNCEI|nr:CoA-acylating methylmalonate-semialdehyde dehydrogenase [Candidatus Eisenbacteria bacterium]
MTSPHVGTPTATSSEARQLKNYIGGDWITSNAEHIPVLNPATGETLASVPMSGADEVNAAVKAAKDAFPAWRETPPLVRARYFFTLKNLLEENVEHLSKILTKEHGKTLSEARGSVRRAIENVEVATGIPTLMQGYNLEDVARGIDCQAIRQPIGVFACIAPFNFPAMVPLWFLPFAVATGNTFIVKPSEQVPMCQEFIFEMIQASGIPPGVCNMIHGGKDSVNAILDNPDIKGVSFVGSTPIARHVYKRAGETGKRVQALGGAKNFLVVMPDAQLEDTASAITESFAGCAGERCLAGSVVLAVGDVHKPLVEKLKEKASNIKVGNGLEAGVTMGPVISAPHRDKIASYVEKGIAEGGDLILDGRDCKVEGHEGGNWFGPTIFDNVKPDATIAKEEIFGPVLTIVPVESLDEAINTIHKSEFANATSIFTQSGPAAREFRYRAEVSMMGINIGVAAPMAFFSFGGTRSSFYGDLKAHGRDSIEFYTDKKMVIERWF